MTDAFMYSIQRRRFKLKFWLRPPVMNIHLEKSGCVLMYRDTPPPGVCVDSSCPQSQSFQLGSRERWRPPKPSEPLRNPTLIKMELETSTYGFLLPQSQ